EKILKIEDNTTKSAALKVLLHILIETNYWDEAVAVIKDFQDNGYKVQRLLKIYQALLKIHQWSTAENIIEIIEEIDNKQQAELRRELAKELMQVFKCDEAERLIETIEEIEQRT